MSQQRINDLEIALRYCLARLIQFEPPDSRAVSDEFVAAAAICEGDPIQNELCIPILEKWIKEDRKANNLD